mmetsp:Transcript_4785/g.7058  ORF Transcript_4785/g.7058 Transcript_4785/m.7058 type:complete len:870 (-) Transcript_4785:187-2796(-)
MDDAMTTRLCPTDDDDDDDDDDKANNDVNSTAITEVMSNTVAGGSQRPTAGAVVSNNTGTSRGSPQRKLSSIIPPASTFRNLQKHFPSYMIKGGRKDGGRHKRLPTTEEGVVYEDESKHNGYDEESNKNNHRGGGATTNKKKALIKEPINSIRDPAQFPLEQYTDGIYGQDFTSYSYATSNPSSVEYDPKPLRRMAVQDTDVQLEEKKRRIIFYGLLTAIFITFFIALASIVSHVKRQHVKAAPENIQSICDISNISTMEGHAECEEACEEAKCCMAPGSLSCFRGQEDVCSMYSPCAALYSAANDGEIHVMVPPPPSDLNIICTFESIRYASGFIECSSACYAGSCCSIPPVGLPESILSSSSNKLDTTTQRKPESCADTHSEVCAAYTACSALEGLEDIHGTPTDLVNSKCTPNHMKTEIGIDDCENACQPRSCCFAESEKRNCYDDNRLWCDEFHACNILTGGDYSPIPTKTESEVDKCSKNSMELSSLEIAMCKTICDPASCCFYEDGGCRRDIDCDYYSFCSKFVTSELPMPQDLDNVRPEDEDIDEILPPSGGQHTPGPSMDAVLKACGDLTDASIPVLIACSNLCDNYTCCFKDTYRPASCHEESTCNKYTPCKKLLKDSAPQKKDVFPAVCSVSDLLSPGGFARCENYCSDHMCCFNDNDCDDYSQCNEFDSCKIMRDSIVTGTDIHGLTTFDYRKACSKDVIYGKGEREPCALICAPHKCCWDGDNTSPCGSEHGSCTEYMPCSILDDGEEIDDPVFGNLESVCDKKTIQENEEYENLCIEKCEKATCCFDGTCEYKQDFCSNQLACESVSVPSIACPVTGKAGGTACTNACEIFKCCKEEGGCFATHRNECIKSMQLCG